MTYAKPGTTGSIVSYAQHYENFIGGEWVAPAEGRYFENPSPVDGQVFCEVARSSAADIDLALDAAHAAARQVGTHLRHRALEHHEQDRRPDRAEPREAGRGRDVGERQAGARDARR